LVPQSRLGISEADEPHDTFLENALAKARHASRATGLPALADDSGLSVDALGGAPGVHSAYYAGREGDREERDRRNNGKLLANLSDSRSAHYVCVHVLVKNAKTGIRSSPKVCGTARLHARLAAANGFGYDPLFLVRELGKTAAELDPVHKNRISHRGIALQKLVALLNESRRR